MPSMSTVELYAAIRRVSPYTVFASGGQEAFPRGPRARVQSPRRDPGRQDSLRQPQGRGRPGARVLPPAGGDRCLDRVPQPLRRLTVVRLPSPQVRFAVRHCSRSTAMRPDASR
jgi:hypothetical protein